MLTRELAINTIDGDHVVSDCLRRGKHDAYVGYADAMLCIFKEGVGKPRQELRTAIRRVFDSEPNCDLRRIDAFCKLLEDPPISKFATDRPGKAAELRCRVFALAAPHHPLVARRDELFESEEQPIKDNIARQIGRPSWAALESELFADVFEYNTLLEFRGFPSPEALLARYNVAQVQAALFDAVSLTVWARANLKEILTRAKLARLLHTVTAPPPGEKDGFYTFRFDGPASVHVQTRRYGGDMARFLPGLIACKDWSMRAEIHRGRSHRRYFLDLKAGQLHADHEVDEFDSDFEEKFCAKWGAEPRSGWTIHREADVLHQGQTAFIPDFSFQHEDGRRVFLEIAAYWTPEYVQTKSAKIDLFPDAPLLLALPQRYAKKWSELPRHVLLFKSALKINAVVEALERVLPVSSFHSQRDGSDKNVIADSQGEQRGQIPATQSGIEAT